MKNYTFTQVLADDYGRQLVEAIEHGCSDSQVIENLKAELLEKFGYIWQD